MNLTINGTFLGPANDKYESLINPQGYSILILILIGLSMSVISILTIFGNIFVFIIYFKTKSLQTPKNYFILSLAVADVIIGVIPVNLYTVFMLYGRWPLGYILCKAWLIIDFWACSVSTLTLLAIAFDRYFAVFFPISHRTKHSKGYVLKFIMLIWVVSFCVWTTAILVYPYATGKHLRDDQCYVQYFFENWQLTFATVSFNYYVPVIITAILYVSISIKLMQRFKDIKFQSIRIGKLAGEDISPSIEESTPTIQRISSTITTGERSLYSNSVSSHLQNSSCISNNLANGDNNTFPQPATKSILCSNLTKSFPMRNNKIVFCFINSTRSDVSEDDGRNIIIKNHQKDAESAFHNECFENSEEIPKTKSQQHTISDQVHIFKKPSENNEHSKEEKQSKTLKHKLNKCGNIGPSFMSIEGRHKALKAHKRGVKLLLLVMLAFAISWLPYALTTAISSTTGIRLTEELQRFCYIIGWLNSLLNPLCYAFGIREFKKGFLRVICRK